MEANECRTRLQGAGVDAPEWNDSDRGQRPGFHPDDEFTRFSRFGWQAFASTPWRKRSSTLRLLTKLWCDIKEVPWPASHSSLLQSLLQLVLTRSVLLFRRLWCQLPLSSATCRCGQPLDSRGHHRSLCQRRGAGSPRVSNGELRCQGLQRSRCQSLTEHPGSGSRPSARAKGGQPSFGSGGRRPPTLP